TVCPFTLHLISPQRHPLMLNWQGALYPLQQEEGSVERGASRAGYGSEHCVRRLDGSNEPRVPVRVLSRTRSFPGWMASTTHTEVEETGGKAAEVSNEAERVSKSIR